MIGDRADAILEDMDEAMHEGKYRRIEVITDRRQRRNWTDEEKARIHAESAEPDVNISAVVRRWGVNRGLPNVWRRDVSARQCLIKYEEVYLHAYKSAS
ncbi:Transposase [compost metagenome]